MGYFQLGPADAALGTIFAQTISVIVALVVIRCKQKGIRLRKADFKPNRNMLGGILSIRTFVYRLSLPCLTWKSYRQGAQTVGEPTMPRVVMPVLKSAE